MQKFVNYKIQLAIVGDFSVYSSTSLHQFIQESNKSNHVIFAETIEEAMEKFLLDLERNIEKNVIYPKKSFRKSTYKDS